MELDALFWQPGWTPSEAAPFRERVEEATAGDRWLVAGNYRPHARATFWPRLTDVVWLDYPLPLLLRRLTARSWRRWRGREPVWGGNSESFLRQLYHPQGVLLHTLRRHHSRRRSLAREMAAPEWAHISFVRLRSPQAAADWLTGVEVR